ncbi:MAG: CDP-diacylglycerol--serine O-phosphatidyltransferase [Geminicoccaceae bacterium]|nr:CDP-diacylglycerol--serine O-phosphatidyltransferase [Geminicoccaceae bacterium]
MMLRNRRRQRQRTRRPLLHMVPNLFTILSLCAGLTGLRYGLDGRYELAVALIVAAAVLDGLDGRAARLLNVQSRLGAELDSLADFFNFGVAPAVLVYFWALQPMRGLGWAVAMLFAVCCALRLARFNTEAEDPHRPRWMQHFFTGVPAPAAAGLALTPMITWFAFGQGWSQSFTLNALTLGAVAVLMVSRVPTFSAKKLRLEPEQIVPALAIAGLVMAFLVTEPWLTLSILALAYLASIPFSVFVAFRMRREEAVAGAVTAPAPGTGKSTEALAAAAGPGGGSAKDRIVPFEPRQGRS